MYIGVIKETVGGQKIKKAVRKLSKTLLTFPRWVDIFAPFQAGKYRGSTLLPTWISIFYHAFKVFGTTLDAEIYHMKSELSDEPIVHPLNSDKQWKQLGSHGCYTCQKWSSYLHFSHATPLATSSGLGQGSGRIWVDNFQCSSTAKGLSWCTHRGWGVLNSCDHSEDIGLRCMPSRCSPSLLLSSNAETASNVNTRRPRQNGRHFAYDIFKCIFLNEIFLTLIDISWKRVPYGLIDNMSTLV